VHFLQQVDEINTGRRRRAVDIARELVGGTFSGQTVAVLGAAFKPETDDVRDSPALSVASTIRSEGATVRLHDPEAMDNAMLTQPDIDYAATPIIACTGADIVLHLTEWRQYRELDPIELLAVVRAPRILEARNALPLGEWQAAGWTVRSMGAGHSQPIAAPATF
jgi:UDPglucose 6-dehydrogenase